MITGKKWTPFIVWKYFGNIVEKAWKIQFPYFCPFPWYGNVGRGIEIFYKYSGNILRSRNFHTMEEVQFFQWYQWLLTSNNDEAFSWIMACIHHRTTVVIYLIAFSICNSLLLGLIIPRKHACPSDMPSDREELLARRKIYSSRTVGYILPLRTFRLIDTKI